MRHEIPLPAGIGPHSAIFGHVRTDEVQDHVAAIAAMSDDDLLAKREALEQRLHNLQHDRGPRAERRLEDAADELQTVQAEIIARSPKRKTQPEPTPADRRAGNRNAIQGAEAWETESGETLYALPPNVSFRAALRDAPKDTPKLGAVIRGLMTGRMADNVRNALSVGSDPDGGYFVAPTIAAEIIDLARAQSAAFRAGARVIPMPSPDLRLVKVTADPTMQWRGENQQITQTTPTFGALTLRAKKMTCLVPISSELLEDGANAETEIVRLLSEAAGAELDRAILAADGTNGSPTGIFSSAGTQDATPTDSPALWDWDAILGGMKLLEDANFSDGFSIIQSPTLARALRGLKDSQLRYLEGPPDAVAIPRYSTTRLAADQAILGRFAECLVGIRSNITIDLSRDYGFDHDQVFLRVRWRGDIGLARAAAFATYDGVQ